MRYAVVTGKQGTNVFFGADDDALWSEIIEVYSMEEVKNLRGSDPHPSGPFIDAWGDVPGPKAPSYVVAAARTVLVRWEQGDLATAVRNLQLAVDAL